MLLMKVNGSMIQIDEGIDYVAELTSQSYSMPLYLLISRLYSLNRPKTSMRSLLFVIIPHGENAWVAQRNLLGEERLSALPQEKEDPLVG
jgi:hypothetical protein